MTLVEILLPLVLLVLGVWLLLPFESAAAPSARAVRWSKIAAVAGGLFFLAGGVWLLLAADRPVAWWPQPSASGAWRRAVCDGLFVVLALVSLAGGVLVVAGRTLQQACRGAAAFGLAHAGICLLQGAPASALLAVLLSLGGAAGALAIARMLRRDPMRRFSAPHCREPLLACAAALMFGAMLLGVADQSLHKGGVRNAQRLQRVIERRRESFARDSEAAPQPAPGTSRTRALLLVAVFGATGYFSVRRLWPAELRTPERTPLEDVPENGGGDSASKTAD